MTGLSPAPTATPTSPARWWAAPPGDAAGWEGSHRLPAVPPAVAAAFAAGGVRAALAALNARAGCRYTALFSFPGPAPARLHFFDRLDPAAGPGADLPLSAVYAVYVRRTDRPFVAADALADIRADDDPDRVRVRAYVGVPVRDRDGRTVGGLCHFDPDPQPGLEAEMFVMDVTAALFGRCPEADRAG